MWRRGRRNGDKDEIAGTDLIPISAIFLIIITHDRKAARNKVVRHILADKTLADKTDDYFFLIHFYNELIIFFL